MEFAEKNDIICPEQHGFKQSRSCETQLLGMTEFIYSLEKGLQTDILTIDFSKVFDKVNHNLLTHKLNHYVIRGKINSWIKHFQDNRQHAVVVESLSLYQLSQDCHKALS